MAEQATLPTEQEFNGFIGRLSEFRSTLPESDQRMLDAMTQAAFKTEQAGEVQGYWYEAWRTPYGAGVVGGPGPVPGFYVTPPPPVVYTVSPWGAVYRGW
jgi:hypothetical protein